MIRITAGKFKNTLLEVPDEISRPLTDRMRTSIFDILSQYLNEAKVLDLYSGSGVMGLESLSRGASYCVFVDESKDACNVINTNIHKCKELEKSRTECIQAQKYIKKTKEKFDLIFIDPPFDRTYKIDIDSLNDLITPDSIVVLRASLNFYRKNRSKIKDTIFEEKYNRGFGQSIVVFYRPKI